MDKKARKKKEREAKKREQRKQASRSPFEKFDASPQNVRALINEDWDEQGLADLLVRRDLAPGTVAIAFFKVSLDVGGLMLAEGYLDATEEEWTDAVADYSQSGKMIPADLNLVRTLVEGGARIASENGLRIPEKWDKWARIYGPPPAELSAADLSKFDRGYYGPLSELTSRLLGYTLEAFLARTDIEVNPEDDLGLFPEWGKAPEPDLSSLDETSDDSPEAVLGRMGETIHPDFEFAAKIAIDAGMAAAPDLLHDFDRKPTDSPRYQASVEKAVGGLPAERQAAVREALAQYDRYVTHRAAAFDADTET